LVEDPDNPDPDATPLVGCGPGLTGLLGQRDIAYAGVKNHHSWPLGAGQRVDGI
jgi:hypothetical protein